MIAQNEAPIFEDEYFIFAEAQFHDDELFLLDDESFDIDAAFQDALSDVVSDQELELAEKVQRIEMIFSEAQSELYFEFVDLQTLSMQLEYYCNHNHDLEEALLHNEMFENSEREKEKKKQKKKHK